jgi:hypothetical protein
MIAWNPQARPSCFEAILADNGSTMIIEEVAKYPDGWSWQWRNEGFRGNNRGIGPRGFIPLNNGRRTAG